MPEQILQDFERNGFAIVNNLISSDDLKSINHFIDQNKAEFVPAMVGKSDKKRMETIRGDHTFWIDPQDPPFPFINLITFLEELKEKLNISFFLGLKQFECHLACYPIGTFYKKHSDIFESDSSRSLSFVFYLNEAWNQEQGGELILYNKEGELVRKLYPQPGTFICFLSSDFPHEVKNATVERRSFTGWMHTKIIY